MSDTRPLRIGVHTPLHHSTIDTLRAVWTRVDELPFDWISVWDHFRPVDGDGDNFDAVVAHAALAACTSRVQVGCLVYCVGYRTPALLASAATAIDHVSAGRAVIGLGAGYLESEYLAYGYDFEPPPTRVDRLASTFTSVRALLDGERVTRHDQFVHLDDATTRPLPQQRHLPMWIGGGGERRTLPLAGRVADGWNIPMATVADFTRKNDIVTESAERCGRNPGEIERSVNLGLCWNDDDLPERFGPRWEQLRPSILGGSADRVLDQLDAYRRAGADRVMLSLRPPLLLDDIERFASDVLPSLR